MNTLRYTYTNVPRKLVTLDEVLEKSPKARPDKAMPLPDLRAQGQVQRVPVMH